MDEGRLLRGKRPGAAAGTFSDAGLLVNLVDISQLRFKARPKSA